MSSIYTESRSYENIAEEKKKNVSPFWNSREIFHCNLKTCRSLSNIELSYVTLKNGCTRHYIITTFKISSWIIKSWQTDKQKSDKRSFCMIERVQWNRKFGAALHSLSKKKTKNREKQIRPLINSRDLMIDEDVSMVYTSLVYSFLINIVQE